MELVNLQLSLSHEAGTTYHPLTITLSDNVSFFEEKGVFTVPFTSLVVVVVVVAFLFSEAEKFLNVVCTRCDYILVS